MLLASACGASETQLSTTTTTSSTTTTRSTASPTTASSPAAADAPTTTTTAPATTTTVPTTTAAEPVAADLYAASCAGCHGDELEGGIGPALGPDGHAQGHTDAELIDIVTNGMNSMPAFGASLTEQQISEVVAFIRGRRG